MERGEAIEGRFRIAGDRIGGGMGAVYRAVDLTDNSVVAIKFLVPAAVRAALDSWQVSPTPAERGRFEQEIRLHERLGGSGIPALIHHGLFRRRPYFAMRYIDGVNLRTFLNTNRPSIAAAVSLAVQLLDTLALVHDDGIVHRDIKPHNVLLESATGLAYTSDFGIALLSDPDATRYTEGQTPGTMGYKAPEVLDGEENPTSSADIYAVGCLFFELMTGRPVFDCQGGELKTGHAHLYDRPPRLDEILPGFPSPLTDLTDRMLAKQPGLRPSAREVAGILRPFLPGVEDPAPHPAIDPDLTLPFRRPVDRTSPGPTPASRRGPRSRGRRQGGTVDQEDFRRTLVAAFEEIHRTGVGLGSASDRLAVLLPAALARWGAFNGDVLTARVLVADRERLHKHGVGARKRYRDIVRDLTGIARPGEPTFATFLAARIGLAECRLSETDGGDHVDDVLSDWAECAAEVRHVPVDALMGQRHLATLVREVGEYIAECGHSDCDHQATVTAVLADLPGAGDN
uniref:serine/threonine-protein kinase n=1 Tax=Streptomyces sp. NRRL S-325 TaxID=1463899 RepID=UPI00099C7B5F|nr:serine/threonine-protein kinase [Streptomyces sp. NRRL S-325]